MTDPFAVPGFGPTGSGKGAAATPARPSAWSVSALLLAAGDALAARFGAVTVRGELSGCTRASSGHCYFTLKDAAGGAGALRCAMFKRAAALCNVPLQDGLQVELRGRLAVYEARGELQMVVESMQRLGAGQLYEEFLRLRARLSAEGLFDAQRKRPLPPFVRTVGVVTSLAGAALHDVVATLARRAPHVRVIVYPSLVQGADAPAALVAALAQVERRDEVDAVLVCRGGGSLEDLWAFNDERVVRALDGLSRPVVSGVGHETDVTLVDLVADLRAATPTAAAEAVAVERAVVLEALTASARRLSARVEQRLQAHAQRLDTAAARLARPAQALGAWRQRVQRLQARHAAALRMRWQALARAQEGLGARLARAGERVLNARRERHQSLGARFVRAAERTLVRHADALRRHEQALANLDPQRVLERGYTLLESRDGHALVSAAALQAGQHVVAVLHDGRADLHVDQVRMNGEATRPAEPAE
ncbi:MAG: exodeoxyribonuclease VII large subunit [Vitreoscilla sp.]